MARDGFSVEQAVRLAPVPNPPFRFVWVDVRLREEASFVLDVRDRHQERVPLSMQGSSPEVPAPNSRRYDLDGLRQAYTAWITSDRFFLLLPPWWLVVSPAR